MREILFRGKVRGLDEWLYGDLHQIGHAIYIDGIKWRLRVEPETVGQFTGLLDKNGNKIFEGDIVKLENKNYKVVFKNYYWTLENFYNSSFDIPTHAFSELEQQDLEVVGNIHDNG